MDRMKLVPLAIGAGMALIGSQVSAGPAPRVDRERMAMPLEGEITNPDWIARPDGRVLAGVYPPLALTLGLGGTVTIACRVTTTGGLDGCKATSEAPRGLGFGAAVLSVTSAFRMKPMTLNGTPVGGARVNIPITFKAPQQMEAADIGETPIPPADPKAMALARQLIDMSGEPGRISRGLDQWLSSIGQRVSDSPQTQQTIVDALREAYPLVSTKYLTEEAAGYATSMSQSELAQVLAFLKSPAGQAWVGAQQKLSGDAAERYKRFTAELLRGVRSRFCRKETCLPEDVPSSPPVAQASVKSPAS